MVERIIELCARNRLLVLLGVGFALVAALVSIKKVKLDAIPDLGKDHPVFIRADRSVPYGELMNVMELLRQGGYTKYKLVALEGVAPAGAAGQPDAAAKP